MQLPVLILCWLASVAPLAVGAWSDGFVLQEAAQAGLVAWPWVVLAGLPRRSDAERPRTSALCALAAPPLALGSGLDLANGWPPGRVLALAAFVLLTVAVSGRAANRASRSAAGVQRRYAWAWLVLVPGTAAGLMLRAQLALPAPGLEAGPEALPLVPAAAVGLGPLSFLHALTRGVWPSGAALGLLVLGLVLLHAVTGRRVAPPTRAPGGST